MSSKASLCPVVTWFNISLFDLITSDGVLPKGYLKQHILQQQKRVPERYMYNKNYKNSIMVLKVYAPYAGLLLAPGEAYTNNLVLDK